MRETWFWGLCLGLWSCTHSVPPSAEHPPAPDPTPYWFSYQDSLPWVSDTLSAKERQALQTGDVLLRQGPGGWSAYIQLVLEESYGVTHCGWVAGDSIRGWRVLHAISSDQWSGVVEEPLASYLKQSRLGSLVLVRPRCSVAERTRALAYIQRQVDAQVPFDMAFDDRDASALYCVELLRDALLHATGTDYCPRRCRRPPLDVLRLNNFFDEQRFEVVWNHWEAPPLLITN